VGDSLRVVCSCPSSHDDGGALLDASLEEIHAWKQLKEAYEKASLLIFADER